MIDLSVLVTESRNKETMGLDQMTPLEIVTVMNREDGKAVEAIGEVLPDCPGHCLVYGQSETKGKDHLYRSRYQRKAGSAGCGGMSSHLRGVAGRGGGPDGGRHPCLCQGSGGSRGQPDHGGGRPERDSSVPGRYRHRAGCQRKDALCDIRPQVCQKDWMQNSGRVLQP